MNNEEYLGNLRDELNRYTRQLSEIKKRFKGAAGEDLDKILKSLQNILKEATKAFARLEAASVEEWEPMKELANQAFDKLRGAFNDFLNTSSDQIKDYMHKIKETSEEGLECASEYIKNNPVMSVLLALGAGFIIGRLLK